MKPWMKILMWFGLGAGIGFFAGQQVGVQQERKRVAGNLEEDDEERYLNEKCQDMKEAFDSYRGDFSTVKSLDEILKQPATDDEPEMPSEEDIRIDPDIPQLHPEHLTPTIISEEEFNLNIWQYEINCLLFYEIDEVLYNDSTQSIIENPDDVIGIGTLFGFGGDPNNPTETIYVKNDTFGVLFRIDRLDAAFCDAVDGSCPPEDDPPEEDDDFNKDDYWNDV